MRYFLALLALLVLASALTPEQGAARLRAWMNADADPCDDFCTSATLAEFMVILATFFSDSFAHVMNS